MQTSSSLSMNAVAVISCTENEYACGVQRAASTWRTLGIRSCRTFVQTWPDSECSHTVQKLLDFFQDVT